MLECFPFLRLLRKIVEIQKFWGGKGGGGGWGRVGVTKFVGLSVPTHSLTNFDLIKREFN